MSTTNLLERLRALDIRLWAEEQRLRFSAPSGALTPELRAEIGQHKDALLALLGAPAGTGAPIPPAPRDRSLPLSFAQQRLWFLDRFEPDSPAYNLPAAVRLSGALDPAALEASLRALAQRHEALRTTFALEGDRPVQVIAPHSDLALPLVEPAGGTAAEREAEARRLIAEEARRPFDLARGPLLRARLLRLAADEHILLLNMHHIVADGWSLGVLIREWLALYAGSAALAPLPVQYADYAVWQREQLQGQALAAQVAYWRGRLADAPPPLELPADAPRPAVASYRGAYESLLLPEALVEPLARLARAEGATPFMALLAAFKVLLFRYSGQTDLCVGTPTAGRSRPEVEGLIGCFVNTLALRSDLSGAPSFRALLARVRSVALEAFAHQDVPFEKLVEELQPRRSVSHAPFFQVMFILQNAPMPPLSLPGLRMERLELERGTANFDLTLTLEPAAGGTRATLEYNSDLFAPATVRRMLDHYRALLASAAAAPDTPVEALELLDAAERRRLLVGWNATAAESPALGLHELFEAQAARTPERAAVRCGADELTYAELERRANMLAHTLRRRGVGRETLVGICVERGVQMLVGLLGVLKAGGAYVPLDPAYPPERLALMLEDSGAPLLLTERALLERLPAGRARPLCLDADWPEIAAAPATAPGLSVEPEQLAYVIYTSGSTGRPKGVQIPHRAVVNFLHSMGREPGLDADDTLLAVTTLSFDIAGLELFLPLSVGARLVLATRADALDGPRLAELLERSGATVMQATPATWRLLLAAGWRNPRGLKLLCGGEALPRELADALLALGGELWNMYGPTETTIWSAVARVAPGERPVPIGRPIANTTLFVLDPRLRPAPTGVPGELYIGGDGLARGYLGRPDLTAERFVPNPFADQRPRTKDESGAADDSILNAQFSILNSRLYRTGDLARWLPDGTVECLGRADFQVKLRGFRIELGEIEAALCRHPLVRQAAVSLREDTPGDQRLVAYVVPSDERRTTNDEGPGISPSVGSDRSDESVAGESTGADRAGFVLRPSSLVGELKAHLAGSLPAYMLPGAFVVLEALPLTPNGKIDRRALPAPDRQHPERAAGFVAPQPGVEQEIAAVWQEVLGLDRVGAGDSFFELGGHSLLLVQVQARLQARFRREFSIVELFQYPTLGALAGFIRQAGRAAEQAPNDADQAERMQDGKQRLRQRLQQRQRMTV